MRYLTPEWLCARHRIIWEELVPVPGVSLRIQHEVDVGGPRPVGYFDEVEDGLLISSGLGTDAVADVTLSYRGVDELAVLRGTADPLDLIIANRVMVTGQQGLLVGIVPILQSLAAEAVRARLDLITED